MTVHSALMSCLPPATFSRSASLSSPSGAAYGITTWTVSAVSATALTLTLPRLVLSCFSMMPFGSLSSASRYFGFSAANLPTSSCTSPRLIDCDIVVSSQVGVRYISSSVAPCPATLRLDAALQEQPAGQLRRNRQVSVPELLTWKHPFARVPTMEPPLHRMEPWLQVVFET